jgi:hypothetical protein
MKMKESHDKRIITNKRQSRLQLYHPDPGLIECCLFFILSGNTIQTHLGPICDDDNKTIIFLAIQGKGEVQR